MRKTGNMILAAAFLGFTSMGASDSGESMKIAIVHTNDTHGYDAAKEPNQESDGTLGFAVAAQVKQELEEEGYEVLMLDAGDVSWGTQSVNYFRGASAFEFMNAAGYDAMAPGCHEFDWGTEIFLKNTQTADFPVLAANLYDEKTGELLLEPSTVITTESGIKVGVFGLVSPELKTRANPRNVSGISVLEGEELYACAQEQADALREEECSLVICIGHLGDGQEPDRTKDVLAHTTGIDLWVGGGNGTEEKVKDTVIVRAGENFGSIGVVTVENGVISSSLITADAYDFEKQDVNVAALIAEKEAWLKEELEAVIGSSVSDLDGGEQDVCTKETNLGDLAADAMLWQARRTFELETVGAVVWGGSFGGSVKKGDISGKSLGNVFRQEEYVAVVTISGTTLQEVLEEACSMLPEKNRMFPQVSGIVFTADTSVPAGKRVTVESVGNVPFDPDARYRIAVSSLMIKEGGAYETLVGPYEENGSSTGILLSDALIDYVTEELDGLVDETYAKAQQRIRIR